MRYGHFDDKRKEYVIERPDTPRSWSNYLGTTEYGAVITNNAGGYGFYKSAAVGRFLRLRFNAIPMDQPGRYFYLRDRESGDYWSASWQPTGKPLKKYKSVCRHGTAYTIIASRYSGVQTETTYFVPLGQNFEYWRLKITNKTKRPRRLSVFTYCEFTTNWCTRQDMINLQYGAYTVKSEWVEGMCRCAVIDNVPPKPEDFADNDQGRWTWMALAETETTGYDLDREAFIGPYRTYANPLSVERGECVGSAAYGDNACGSLQTEVTLEPGQSREILVLLGIGKAEVEGKKTLGEYGNLRRATEELDELKRFWHGKLDSLTVKTPDEDFNHMINVWNAYNCLITFNWSRAASLVYSGERDGLGYRDTVQDFMGAVPLLGRDARARLELMLTGQESTGGANPLIKPFAHHPGKMPRTSETSYRADDCLWLFNAVPLYVAETGDVDFYYKVLPYSDEGEAAVLGHLRRALEFNLERRGARGLPCGLDADWNDCLRLGHRGESLFVAFQLRYGLEVYAGICDTLGNGEEAAWARRQREDLDGAIQRHAWDGEWFVRAFREDGSVIGAKNDPEGSIFLNPQSWAVISGAAAPEQAARAMDSVNERLATEYGLMVCAPPFEETPYHVVRAVLINGGQKENAGIFNHTQGWAVMAECLLGRGDRAYEYYRAYMPAAYNDRAEIRQIEPYVHAQSTHSRYSRRYGASRIPWLSGTASWSYYSAAQYILGLRPEPGGLRVDPCIPAEWPGFTARRRFRGRAIKINVKNPRKVCRGVKKIKINGKTMEGNLIPVEQLREENKVEAELG